jgi:chromosomal replication initiation ATPase DnaA
MNDLEFVERLQLTVAKAAGLQNVEALLHRRPGSREHYLCKFRDAAIFLARTRTELGVIRLGQLFGGRDASTITTACQREELRLKRNAPRKDKKTHAQWHQSLLDAMPVAIQVEVSRDA